LYFEGTKCENTWDCLFEQPCPQLNPHLNTTSLKNSCEHCQTATAGITADSVMVGRLFEHISTGLTRVVNRAASPEIAAVAVAALASVARDNEQFADQQAEFAESDSDLNHARE
jgi:hypothetical protein